MKAAIVHERGQLPRWEEYPDPVPAGEELVVDVRAAALSQLARARASGAHYSAGQAYPFVAGVDGVGTLPEGRRVYFALPQAPWGAMAEKVVIPRSQIVDVPDDLDDATAAALANPGMSSWMALNERAGFRPGETVLINGATGVSGQLAVQIARHLGAARIVATGRNPAALAELPGLGADRVIPLTGGGDDLSAALADELGRGVDVVLDYLWGPSAEAILGASLKAGTASVPLRFVQIGSIGGAAISLPGGWLRSRAIELMGSGIGSVAPDRLLASVGAVFGAAGPAGLRIGTVTAPMEAAAEVWNRETGTDRLVLTRG